MLNKNLVFAFMILVLAACRVLHLHNFAPELALAFFAGLMFSSRWLAFGFPLVALLLSDLLLAITNPDTTYLSYLSGGEFVFTYLIYAVCTWFGSRILGKVNLQSVGLGMLSSVLLFFVVSNFEVWAAGKVGYPYTWQGLMTCYAAGLEFLKPQLIGNGLAAGVLYGGYAVVQSRFKLAA